MIVNLQTIVQVLALFYYDACILLFVGIYVTSQPLSFQVYLILEGHSYCALRSLKAPPTCMGLFILHTTPLRVGYRFINAWWRSPGPSLRGLEEAYVPIFDTESVQCTLEKW